ncbi:hypothetical protein HN51_049813 [Arachis hypogaea]
MKVENSSSRARSPWLCQCCSLEFRRLIIDTRELSGSSDAKTYERTLNIIIKHVSIPSVETLLM